MARTSPTRSRRWRLALAWSVGALLALGLVLPVVLSPLATAVVNRRLATLSGFEAHVGRVRLAPWKRAVEFEDFVVRQRDHDSDGPLIKVQQGTVTLVLSALIRGKVRIHGSISDTSLVVHHDEPAATARKPKDGKDAVPAARAAPADTWRSELHQRFEVEIDRFEITRTRVQFVAGASSGNPALTIAELHLVARNLTTEPGSADELPAQVEVSARFPEGGTLRAAATLAPLADRPRFKASLEVKDLALVPLRELLRAYARVDVRQGTFDVFIEAEAEGGTYAGYAKPFFHDLEFKALPDPEKGLIRNSALKVASAVTDLLKNDQQKVATKAPFQGSFDDPEVDLWATIQNLLRNAFIQSLREGFEGRN